MENYRQAFAEAVNSPVSLPGGKKLRRTPSSTAHFSFFRTGKTRGYFTVYAIGPCVLAIVLLSGLFRAGAANAPGFRLPYQNAGYDLGTGIDHNLMNASDEDAVSAYKSSPFDSSRLVLKTNRPWRVTYGIERIHKLSEYTKDNIFGISASASSPYGSIAASYNKTKHFESSSDKVHFTMFARGVCDNITIDFVRLQDLGEEALKPEVRSLLARLRAGGDAAAIRGEFRDKYGTAFIREIESGGFFKVSKSTSLSKTLSSEEVEKAANLCVNAWGGGLQVTANEKNKEFQKIAKEMLSTRGDFVGGRGSVVSEETPQALNAYLNGSAGTNSWLENLAEKPVVLSGDTLPYYSLRALEPLAGRDFGTWSHPLSAAFCLYPTNAPKWSHVRVGMGEGSVAYELGPLLFADATRAPEYREVSVRLRMQQCQVPVGLLAESHYSQARNRERYFAKYLPKAPPPLKNANRIWPEIEYPVGHPEHLKLRPDPALMRRTVLDYLQSPGLTAEFLGSGAAVEWFRQAHVTNGVSLRTMLVVDEFQVVPLYREPEALVQDWARVRPDWAERPFTLDAETRDWVELGPLLQGQRFRATVTGSVKTPRNGKFDGFPIDSTGLKVPKPAGFDVRPLLAAEFERKQRETSKASYGAVVYRLEYRDHLNVQRTDIGVLMVKGKEGLEPIWIKAPYDATLSVRINAKAGSIRGLRGKYVMVPSFQDIAK